MGTQYVLASVVVGIPTANMGAEAKNNANVDLGCMIESCFLI